MRSGDQVRAALALAAEGANPSEIGRRLGIPRATVREWIRGTVPRSIDLQIGKCCGVAHGFADLPRAYAYLLGLYLGDGWIATHPRGVYRLRIILDAKYPMIVAEASAAIKAVRGRTALNQARPDNSVEVSAYWRCWPCLFPQHGPGKKHDRTIALTEWQRELVRRHPGLLLRGLIHSDGSRFTNTGTKWTCPRYSFSNRSQDI